MECLQEAGEQRICGPDPSSVELVTVEHLTAGSGSPPHSSPGLAQVSQYLLVILTRNIHLLGHVNNEGNMSSVFLSCDGEEAISRPWVFHHDVHQRSSRPVRYSHQSGSHHLHYS